MSLLPGQGQAAPRPVPVTGADIQRELRQAVRSGLITDRRKLDVALSGLTDGREQSFPGLLQRYGISEKDFLGAPFEDFLPPTPAQRVANIVGNIANLRIPTPVPGEGFLGLTPRLEVSPTSPSLGDLATGLALGKVGELVAPAAARLLGPVAERALATSGIPGAVSYARNFVGLTPAALAREQALASIPEEAFAGPVSPTLLRARPPRFPVTPAALRPPAPVPVAEAAPPLPAPEITPVPAPAPAPVSLSERLEQVAPTKRAVTKPKVAKAARSVAPPVSPAEPAPSKPKVARAARVAAPAPTPEPVSPLPAQVQQVAGGLEANALATLKGNPALRHDLPLTIEAFQSLANITPTTVREVASNMGVDPPYLRSVLLFARNHGIIDPALKLTPFGQRTLGLIAQGALGIPALAASPGGQVRSYIPQE